MAYRNPVGRPRSALADHAIAEATVDVLAEVGYDRLTIESVAIRAGVAKTTIYRRWPAKEGLVLDAMGTVLATPVAPDTGNVHDDLVAMLRTLVLFVRTSEAGRLAPALAAVAENNPDLAAALERFVTCRREPLLEILRRGVARGELRSDVDVELMADVIASPVFFRRMFRRRSLGPRLAAQLVEAVLTGIEKGRR